MESFAGVAPRIDARAFIHSAAVLIGDVTVGPESSVWPNVTLRGDDAPIVIGAQTSIQDGTTIHATEGESRTTVGARVTVGHNALLHGCTVGDDCLIGMGSILLDNAVVEPWAFVAAGTLVPPGKVVRAGTLVMGNPMRVVRECTEKDREWIVHSWRSYVKRAREYLERDHARGRGRDRER
ncbi:MAG: gamma carbonic anhydrase family protein [Myxococcales bacterium]|nr:gamma carbonic anhydrase family protein [Myxococcales bacterium]